MLKVKELLKAKGSNLWCVEPGASILSAIHLMTEKKIGALPVKEGNNLSGIITERDITRIISQHGHQVFDEPVEKYMTHEVVTVSQEDSLEACMQLMIDENFRHLPVVSEEGLVGLLSIRDLVRVILTQRDALITDLENYIVGKR